MRIPLIFAVKTNFTNLKNWPRIHELIISVIRLIRINSWQFIVSKANNLPMFPYVPHVVQDISTLFIRKRSGMTVLRERANKTISVIRKIR